MIALDLLIDCAATYRLTRLTTVDTFPPIKAARDAIVERHTITTEVLGIGNKLLGHNHEPDAIAELIQCPYCCSAWLAAAVVAARLFAPKWWHPIATVLALSAVAGNVSARLDEDDRE